MPRRNTSRAAQGTGTIRKKTVTKNGHEYTYWEARITVGRDPGTGKQIQKSFTGKTQKEVREKMQAVTVEVNEGTYHDSSKLTLGTWLNIWADEYLGDVKPFTVVSYKTQIRVHIKPALGAVKLSALAAHDVQRFYNSLSKPRGDSPALSAKTIKNIHGVLHRALQQAVENQYIKVNPSDVCKLPRVVKKELKPLDEQQIADFLKAIKGHRYETFYTVTLFTGMREGEAIGLKWDCVDFKKIAASIGCPDLRVHDLRHSYAVASIRAGDDIKTVQGNLGHATAAFTLDVYGHVTEQMKQASAERMEGFIKDVLSL